MPTYSLDFERPLLEIERQIEELKKLGGDHGDELAALERQLAALRADVYKTLTPMQRVQVARHPKRPYTLDYLRTVRSEERRVGKECRAGWWTVHEKKNDIKLRCSGGRVVIPGRASVV